MRKLIAFFMSFLLFMSTYAHAQVDSFAALDETENHFARLINQGLINRDKSALRVSKSLTAMARWKLWDMGNSTETNECNKIHSWSNKKPDIWTPYCQSNQYNEEEWQNSVRKKAQEIADYTTANSFGARFIKATTPEQAIQLLAYNSFWSKNHLRTFGIAMRGDLAVIYYADGEDKQGYHSVVDKAYISTVSGAWYDPTYSGLGFNVVQVPAGTYLYFYGYKGNADGKAQWLLSGAGPRTVVKGESYQLDLYSGFLGNGGSFITKPKTASAGLKKWGTATVTFNSCANGVVVLDGEDGRLTHNIIKLAHLNGLDCADN